MKDTLASAEQWVKLDEGGYGNDPNDHGGPTKYGITIEDYRENVNPHGTAADVSRLTIDQAFKIYVTRYWNPCDCDLLPVGVDYFTFDSAILSGTGTAIRWLQRAVGAVPDGQIGPKTLAAVAADHPMDILLKMEALRRQRLRTLAQWPIYGRGWTNRVNKSKTRALKLIKAQPALEESHPTPAVPAGPITQVAAPISPAPEGPTLTTAPALPEGKAFSIVPASPSNPTTDPQVQGGGRTGASTGDGKR